MGFQDSMPAHLKRQARKTASGDAWGRQADWRQLADDEFDADIDNWGDYATKNMWVAEDDPTVDLEVEEGFDGTFYWKVRNKHQTYIEGGTSPSLDAAKAEAEGWLTRGVQQQGEGRLFASRKRASEGEKFIAVDPTDPLSIVEGDAETLYAIGVDPDKMFPVGMDLDVVRASASRRKTAVSDEDKQKIMTPGSVEIPRENVDAAIAGGARVYGYTEVPYPGIIRVNSGDVNQDVEFYWVGSNDTIWSTVRQARRKTALPGDDGQKPEGAHPQVPTEGLDDTAMFEPGEIDGDWDPEAPRVTHPYEKQSHFIVRGSVDRSGKCAPENDFFEV